MESNAATIDEVYFEPRTRQARTICSRSPRDSALLAGLPDVIAVNELQLGLEAIHIAARMIETGHGDDARRRRVEQAALHSVMAEHDRCNRIPESATPRSAGDSNPALSNSIIRTRWVKRRRTSRQFGIA